MLFISMIGLIIKFIRKVFVLQLFYLFLQTVPSLRFRANSQNKATGQIEKVCQLLCVQKQTSYWYDSLCAGRHPMVCFRGENIQSVW